jgi:hypothetical protein
MRLEIVGVPSRCTAQLAQTKGVCASWAVSRISLP